MKIKIQFAAGTSRHGDYGVNYLIEVPFTLGLYAEIPVPDGASDDYGYFTLKQEILRQAAAHSITPAEIDFWYDAASEAHLEPDASADAPVSGW